VAPLDRDGADGDEAREAAGAGGVAQHRHVEPAHPPRATGDRAVLVALLADVVSQVLVVALGVLVVVGRLADDAAEFGRERAATDTGEIGLDDADDLAAADHVGAEAATGHSAAGGRVRGRDVGVVAVVDVDERALGTLEHDLGALRPALGEEVAGVDGHVLRGEALAEGLVLLVEDVDVEAVVGVDAVDVLGERALYRDNVLQSFAEHLGVEQVADADAAAAGLVLVGRADAATGGVDLEVGLAFDVLLDAVEDAVIREDDVCAAGDPHVGLEAALAELVELVEEGPGVDDTAVPEDAHLAADGAARDERELVLLALVDHGVAGVVAALIADDHVGGVTVDVHDASLPLVAELGANDGDGHTPSIPPTGVNRLRSTAHWPLRPESTAHHLERPTRDP